MRVAEGDSRKIYRPEGCAVGKRGTDALENKQPGTRASGRIKWITDLSTLHKIVCVQKESVVGKGVPVSCRHGLHVSHSS